MSQDRETTIGVAIPVPEPWASRLQEVRIQAGEERARHITTHITLLPPTQVTMSQARALEEHLAHIAATHSPFDVVLRGSGTFRPLSPVVYVQVARGVASCEMLEGAIREGPLNPTRTFPYHPHVTVAQEVPQENLDQVFEQMADFSCRFTASTLHSYVHEQGRGWCAAGVYELTGQDET